VFARWSRRGANALVSVAAVVGWLGSGWPGSVWGQGAIEFANLSAAGTNLVNAPIYHLDGVTRLEGNEFSAQFFYGAIGTADEMLTGLPAPIQGFNTGIFAGYFASAPVVQLPGIPVGTPARIQVAVWANQGGTVTSWEAATIRARSPSFDSLPLGDAFNPSTIPALAGLESFSLAMLPQIAAHPQSMTVGSGGNVVFSVTASGTPPLGYHWLFNGTNLVGQTAATLAISNVMATHAGTYAVMVTNRAGAVVSAGATLQVSTPDGDGDGLPDAWEIEHFASTSHPDGAPGSDPDGDGLRNVEEYLTDGDPTDGGSYPRITIQRMDEGVVMIEWQAGSMSTQVLQRCSNPAQSVWVDIWTNPPPTPSLNMRLESIGTTGLQLYRIKFSR
jgi:hypothetical protein